MTMTDRDWVARHMDLLNGEIPAEVAEHIGMIVADTIAIACYPRQRGIGATRHDRAGTDMTPGTARVWGDGSTATPLDAAFLNGTAAEVLDFQEVLINGRNNGHAAVVIVPAVLALAGQIGAAPERVLRAIWIALAANLGLGEALGRAHRTDGPGFRTTSLTAGPAAALGCALLASDDAASALNALSIAACSLPAGLLAAMNAKEGAYSIDKDLSVGLSANHALRSAMLALAGAGGPHAPITGLRGWLASYGMGSEDASYLATEPRDRDIRAYCIKLYPANFGCQSAIRAIIELHHELAGQNVTGLEITVKSSNAASLANRNIDNHISARFSLAYSAASAWMRGRSVLEDFEEAAVADTGVLDFMNRVEVIGSDEMERRHHAEGVFPASVTALNSSTRLATRAYDGPFDGFDEAARQAAFHGKLKALCPPPLAAALAGYAAAPLDAGASEALARALAQPPDSEA